MIQAHLSCDIMEMYAIEGERFKMHEAKHVTEEKLSLFSSNTYYDEVWKAKKSWNWGAFLGGPFWLAYRKMYLYAVLFTIIDILLISFSNVFIDPSGKVSGWLQLVLYVIVGILSNNLYLHHAEQKITKISTMYGDTERQNIRLSQAGGTSIYGMYGIGLLFAVYIVIAYGNY